MNEIELTKRYFQKFRGLMSNEGVLSAIRYDFDSSIVSLGAVIRNFIDYIAKPSYIPAHHKSRTPEEELEYRRDLIERLEEYDKRISRRKRMRRRFIIR